MCSWYYNINLSFSWVNFNEHLSMSHQVLWEAQRSIITSQQYRMLGEIHSGYLGFSINSTNIIECLLCDRHFARFGIKKSKMVSAIKGFIVLKRSKLRKYPYLLDVLHWYCISGHKKVFIVKETLTFLTMSRCLSTAQNWGSEGEGINKGVVYSGAWKLHGQSYKVRGILFLGNWT